jgi:hypothetical protein
MRKVGTEGVGGVAGSGPREMQVVVHGNGQAALGLRTLVSRFVTRCFTCAKYDASWFFCARRKENLGHTIMQCTLEQVYGLPASNKSSFFWGWSILASLLEML